MVFLEMKSKCCKCFVAFLVMDNMKHVPAVTKSGPLSQTPKRSRTYGKKVAFGLAWLFWGGGGLLRGSELGLEGGKGGRLCCFEFGRDGRQGLGLGKSPGTSREV